MFFNEWYNKNTKSFLDKSTKEKMYTAHNYGFEEGSKRNKYNITQNYSANDPLFYNLEDREEYLAILKFIKLLGVERIANFIMNQNKSIKGLQNNNDLFVKAYKEQTEKK